VGNFRSLIDLEDETGCKVTVEEWGCNNAVITSIKRDGKALIPYDNPAYTG
jgi:hypothetical protein